MAAVSDRQVADIITAIRTQYPGHPVSRDEAELFALVLRQTDEALVAGDSELKADMAEAAAAITRTDGLEGL